MNEQAQAVQNKEAMSEALVEKLRTVPILSSLKDEELRCLEGVEEIRLTKGTTLVHQGESVHNFWILLEGEVQIFWVQPDGRETSVASMPKGAAFGEVPLLANIPCVVNVRAAADSDLLQLSEQGFWNLMTTCPTVRKAILANMGDRFQRMQSVTIQQEKMASLGTLAAGLMHELKNPGSAARRAASQLRQNLMRMHELSRKFKQRDLTIEQKKCMFEMQDLALAEQKPRVMSSLEQSDAEEHLAEWLESVNVENAWKLAPTLVSIGMDEKELTCARAEFPGEMLSDALSWLDAMVSSMQLVGTIEESIGRVTDLVHAVKSYAYEGKGKRQAIDVNESIHATILILAHKMREKELTIEKTFSPDLPPLESDSTGLNQIWTNLLDNAIDAAPQKGKIQVRTWAEKSDANGANPHTELCVMVADNGGGIPAEIQPQIFDQFYTTKPVGVGTGIGLGIVQRIVDQYGGSIHFSSVPGNTEFVVRIPATRQ
ncbi:sensor histidine kinase [Edaphobacter acidisoli]|uniref:histidine kinase n=1 Tax=Edaphobacter acidisoli TaxID=2040573 RepID=A0A916RZ68_9BACT|nr:ATP-binding protein [Edaphobacter acidisoli]GGA77737.1 sensor histidine kinase [Edaphobacter acidisoli]